MWVVSLGLVSALVVSAARVRGSRAVSRGVGLLGVGGAGFLTWVLVLGLVVSEVRALGSWAVSRGVGLLGMVRAESLTRVLVVSEVRAWGSRAGRREVVLGVIGAGSVGLGSARTM